MNTNEKARSENKRRHEASIYTFDPESYEMLCNGYWFTLFISGVCFMWAFNHLNWLTGIGWFFLSNLISVIAVRFELILKTAFVLFVESRNSGLVKYSLN